MSYNIFRQLLLIRRNSVILQRWKSSEKNASNFKEVIAFDPLFTKPQKTKEAYLKAIEYFEQQDTRRRGHVEFIYAALAKMEEFGVHKDLDVYKSLMDVLPKGKFIPTNIFQAEFMHYPKQQQCAIDVLEQMEDNGVIPDTEMEQMLLNTFGRRGIPLRKYWRMMYWMPKFKNLTPWPLPEPLPDDALELAKLAIERITSVDADTKLEIWQTDEIEASLDKTWIISAQSRVQKHLLSRQPTNDPLVIKGPYCVYLKDQSINYFLLLGKIREEYIDDKDLDDVSNIETPHSIPGVIGKTTLPQIRNTVHEQDDGTIVAVCATGTSSRDSLLSWVRLLEKYDNPDLANIPVIFTLLAPPTDVSLYESEPTMDSEEYSGQ